MSNPLTDLREQVLQDLRCRVTEFDAIVTAGDMHGVALGAVIASVFDKPLMLICRESHGCVQSHIVSIGECKPDQRYLYVDDFFTFGHSLKAVFDYVDSSGQPAPIVATYEVNTRTWKETGRVVNSTES